jgi:hypothetical protein
MTTPKTTLTAHAEETTYDCVARSGSSSSVPGSCFPSW